MALKPNIVLIHGAWHTPASYAKLTTALELEGFKVHIPPLPSMSGQRPPTADLYTDSDFIHDYVTKLSDQGIQTIALMHSYGGQVGSNALLGLGASKRKTGGVVELVYMAAFAVTEGTSMSGWVASQGHGDLLPLAFDFQDDGIVMSRDPKTLIVGAELLSAEDMDEYLGTFTTAVSKSWTDELKQAAWREIPVTYIQTTQDMTVPPDYQEKFQEMIRAAGTPCTKAVIETGHCPNVTAPEKVVEVLKAVAARAVA